MTLHQPIRTLTGEARFTFGQHDIVLACPAGHMALTAHARATEWGVEYLWGALSTDVRQKLAAGGCDHRAFQRIILGLWRSAQQPEGVPLRLEVQEDEQGLVVVQLGAEKPPCTPLVRASVFFEFRWREQVSRFPLRLPADGSAGGFWDLLPKEAQTVLEDQGGTPATVNAELTAQAVTAIGEAAGRYVPSVYLAIAKVRRIPKRAAAWTERPVPSEGTDVSVVASN